MKSRWLALTALAALAVVLFGVADTASARPVMPEFLLERLDAVSSFLEKQGYERGSSESGKAKSSGYDVSADCLRYTQWFTRTKVIKSDESQGSLLDETYGESVSDKVLVIFYYPDWLGGGEACGVAEFPGVIEGAFSKVRKHFEAVNDDNKSGENFSYNEEIKRTVYSNAPDGNYELSQSWLRLSNGPAKGGWNVNEGSWSMFHQPWKELDDYNLNASVKLYGAAFSSKVPFAFQIMTSRYEDTDVKPGGGGKLSEDLSKDGFWKPMRGTAEKIMGIILAESPQKPDAPAAAPDAPEPGLYLSIEASLSSLPADGAAKSVLTVSTYEVDEKNRERKPLSGKKISLSIEQAEGVLPGSLSAKIVTTGGDGTASAEFTAPAQKAIEGKKINKATVIAESPGFGKDDVNIQLETFAPLTVKAEHQILPAGAAFESRITFTFGAPGELQKGKEIKAVISVASKGGRLSPKGGQQGQGGDRIEVNATPGVENSVYYHWGAEQPSEKAVDEMVTIEIPSMALKGSVPFSVGVDLALTGGGMLSPGTVMPGLFVPYKVYAHDRFHKGADLGAMFKTFGIEPALEIVQTDFQPLSAMDAKEDFYTRLASHIKGSVSPGNSLSSDVLVGGVFRDKDGGWFLIWKDYDGKGLRDGSMPGILPWNRGTYQIELRFDPRWKWDATSTDHTVKLAPLVVEGKGQGDAHMESFIIPMLKNVVSIVPGGDSALLAVNVSVELHRTGDYAKAAQTIGRHYALDFLSGKLTDAVQPSLENALEKKVWGGERGKWVQKRFSDLAHKANEGIKGLEKMTGEQIDACISYGKQSLAGYIAGMFADSALEPLKGDKSALPQSIAAPLFAALAWADRDPAKDMVPLASFLKGYGGDAAVVLLENRDGALENISSGSTILKPAPGQVFAFRTKDQRVQDSGKWLAVSLQKGESIVVKLKAESAPLRLFYADARGVKMTTIGKGSPLGESVSVTPSGFAAGASAPNEPSTSAGVVTGSGVRMREDHSLEGKVVGTPGKGETVEILEKWTSPSDMAIIREDCVGMYDDRQYSFKKGMGVHVIEHEFESEEVIVGIMQDGEMVKYGLHIEFVEAQKEQIWYLIRTEKGLEGWIFGKFIEEK